MPREIDSASSVVPATERNEPPAQVLWDHQGCLPLRKTLVKGAVVLLLTPVVVPLDPDEGGDPFEPLGQAVAQYDFRVQHVPYTKAKGITDTHGAFIQQSTVVIFVITGLSDRISQLDLAEMVLERCGTKRLIMVACCDFTFQNMQWYDFETVIRISGFSKASLGAVGSALLDIPDSPVVWSVKPWSRRDIGETHDVWTQTLSERHVDQSTLALLLDRKGYAMHYVVREPANGMMVGFCATYTTFADQEGHRLVGTIAAIVVRKGWHGQGIGWTLYNWAIRKLRNSSDKLTRIQLGGGFPRLLSVPLRAPYERRLPRLGWSLDESGPGKGQHVADWIVRFSDLTSPSLAPPGLSFKSCEEADVENVLTLARRALVGFGEWEQYTKVISNGHLGHIMLGFRENALIATAITYIPSGNSPTEKDLPWAAYIGSNIGGVTCIQIQDDDTEGCDRGDDVMVGMLGACFTSLSGRNMAGMFVDGVKTSEYDLTSLGYRRWTEYREVWRSQQLNRGGFRTAGMS